MPKEPLAADELPGEPLGPGNILPDKGVTAYLTLGHTTESMLAM